MDILLNLAADRSDWWDVVPALLGAIVGSATGAVPAFILARRSAREVLERDVAARKEATKAATFRMSVKLLGIANEVGDLRRYINEWLDTVKHPGREHMEPFQRVPPMVGLTDHDVITFDPDELAVLFAAGQTELMEELTLLQRRAASAHASFRAYCDRRDAWKDVAPVPDLFEGSLGSATVTEQQMRALKLHTIPLNDLITSLAKHLDEDWRLVQKVTAEFSMAARPILERPGFTIVPDAENSGPADAPANSAADR